MALIIAIIAILLLVRARSTKEYLFSAGLIALAALFHSAYWVLLFFIPLWILINRKNGIKLVLLIIVIIYMVSIFSDNLLFRIYSHFLIREATIDKYMTGHYANMTGALYNTVKYLFIIFPVLYYYSRHSNNQEISSPKQKSLRSVFNHKILKLNIIFSLVLVPQFFAVNFSRLFFILIIFNYIYIANQIGVSRKIIKPRLFSIAYASSLLLLMLLWESETTLDDVFFMHFETNKLLNLF